MRAISREEAVEYANRVLAADDANSSERRLARYVLALEAIVESFVRDAEQSATPEPPLVLDAPCGVCGWRIMHAANLTEVIRRHELLVQRRGLAPHAMTLEQAPGRILVLTEGTVREVEHPSGEAADRDTTGGNDRYSNS